MDYDFAIGIDPGQLGALVALDMRDKVLEQEMMPTTAENIACFRGIFELLEAWQQRYGRPCAALERVNGGACPSSNTAFSLGRSLQAPLDALVALKIPHVLVGPKDWQKLIHSGLVRNKKQDAKSLTAEGIGRLLPDFEVRDDCSRNKEKKSGILDAASIAYWAPRHFAGRISE